MALQPPKIVTQDPGAHELDESSDDHFSSADEGTPHNTNRYSDSGSPIPTTRVERVDDLPAHGEVPGTPAYSIRTQDAVPDEIEIVPEGQRSRSGTRSRALSNLSVASANSSRPGTPLSPGGTPIPKTVVERVDDKPAHGEVQGTAAWEIRQADAEPDEVKRVSEREGREESHAEQPPVSEEDRQAWFRSMWEGGGGPAETQAKAEEADDEKTNNDDDQDFGDDFDEFAEGQEGGGDDDDDDFGDFDDADETPMAPEPAAQPSQQQQPQIPDALAGLPPLDLSLPQSLDAYLSTIFPDAPPTPPSTPPSDPTSHPGTAFISDRSLSLWQQLLQPPPMAPPNWTRSRIRRLFLVSLGVPVDLDEILPPSKQKRLVLPNINLPAATPSPRPSTQLDRLKAENNSANASSTSIDSKTGAPKRSTTTTTQSRRAKGPPPPPDFDLNAASLVCATTDAKLAGLEDAELHAHMATLKELSEVGEKVVEYWLGRVDEGLKEKEALEGVIENLVGFVKGMRQGGR